MSTLTNSYPPLIMADGPNHEQNFLNGILNPEVNMKEIVRYLRFFKGEKVNSSYLRIYLKKLCKPEYKETFIEFIGDMEDKTERQELLDALADQENANRVVTKTTETEVKADESAPVTDTTVVEVTEAPKKRGRKAKTV